MQLTESDRQALSEQRAEFWNWVSRVALGVFLGQIAFALVAYAVFRLWLDSAL